MNITTIALAISLLANVALTYAYLDKRDDTVAASTHLTHATADVKACNSSVDDLGAKSDQRAADAAPKRAAAKVAANKLNAEADTILSTPAAIPGDDCKSVTKRANDWFKEAP